MSQQQETSTRQERLNEIIAEYFAAVEAGHPPDREDFVQRHGPFATELREFFADGQMFERMARTLSVAPGIGGAGTAGGAPATIAAAPGDRIRYFGDYELAEELARGGMGVVYRARQISLNRFVALKMILSGQFASREEVVRFHSEAESAASLDHPNIIPIHEVGEHHAQHYFTMKLIDGGNVEQWAKGKKPGQREIAALMVAVARAVHFGHQRGILHRDLKPGNVLVDSAGVPYVVDFGIAKRLDADHGLTRTTDVMGSPAYMAPEQAAGKAREISVATDVYGLGAILYCLLTGRPPFMSESAAQTLRLVLEAEPARPRAVKPGIDADLQTICLKCLEKDPARRFASAQTVADDLQRWLDGKPIVARPASPAERVVKWAKRRPSLAALVGVSLLTLAVLAWVLPLSYVRVRTALTRETAALKLETAARTRESEALARATAARAQATFALTQETAAKARETAALKESRERLVQASVTRGIEATTADDPGAALLWFASALRDETNADRQRVLRTRIALGLRQLPRVHGLWTGDPPLCFTADGKGLVGAGGVSSWLWSGGYRRIEGSRLVCHDLTQPEAAQSATPKTPKGGLFGSFHLSFNVTRNAPPASGGGATAEPAANVDHATVFTDITSPVTRLVQSIDAHGDAQNGVTLTFWDVAQLKALGRTGMLPAKPRHVSYSADGSRAAVLYDELPAKPGEAGRGVVRSFDVNSGAELGPPVAITRISWVQINAAGTQVATVSGSEFSDQGYGSRLSANVWDIATGKSLFDAAVGQSSLIRPGQAAGQAIFSPDGSRLLALWGGGGAGVMRTWDVHTGKPLSDEQFFRNLAFSGGGAPFIAPSGGFDSNDGVWVNHADTVSFRYAKTGQPNSGITPGGTVEGIGWSPDRRMIVSAAWLNEGHAVRIWSADLSHRSLTPRMVFGEIPRVLFSPDGRRIAVAGGETLQQAVTQVRDTMPPAEQSPYPQFPVNGSQVLALSPDGRRAVALVYPHDNMEKAGLEIMDLQTGKRVRSRFPADYQVRAAFSPDGSRVALVQTGTSRPFGATILNSETGEPLPVSFHPAPADPASVNCFVRYSPDGNWIVEDYSEQGGGGNLIRQAWNAVSGAKLVFPAAAGPNLNLVCFSDDSRLALLADTPRGTWVSNQYASQSSRVWDVATRKPVSPILGQNVDCACFSADGRYLIVCGLAPANEKTLTLFEVATGRQAWSTVTPPDCQELAFSPDGSKIAAWSQGTIEIRNASDGTPLPVPIDCFDGRRGSMRFSADGRLLIAWNTTDWGHRVGIYDARTSEPVGTFDLPSPFQSEASPVFAGPDRMLLIRDFRPIAVDFAPDSREPATLDMVIELLSGRKLQPNGLLARLSTDELVKTWQMLKAAGAPEVGERN